MKLHIKDITGLVKDILLKYIKEKKITSLDPKKLNVNLAHECQLASVWDRPICLAVICEVQGWQGFILLYGRKLLTGAYNNMEPLEVFQVDKTFKTVLELGGTPSADEHIHKIHGQRVGTETVLNVRISFRGYEVSEDFIKKVNSYREAVSKKDMLFSNFAWLNDFETHAQPVRKKVEKANIGADTKPAPEEENNEEVALHFDINLNLYNRTNAIAILLLASMELTNPIGMLYWEHRQQGKIKEEKIKATLAAPGGPNKKKKLNKGGKKKDDSIEEIISPTGGDMTSQSPWSYATQLSGSESFSEDIAVPIDINLKDIIAERLEAREGEYSTWKTIKLHIGVWNVEEQIDHKQSLDSWLTPEDNSDPDLYVIGVINVGKSGNFIDKIKGSRSEEWMKIIEHSGPFQQKAYSRVKYVSFEDMLTVVYAKSFLMPHIDPVHLQTCQMLLKVKNIDPSMQKLSKKTDDPQYKIFPRTIGIRLKLYSSSFCFVNVLLPPGTTNGEWRTSCLPKIYQKVWFYGQDTGEKKLLLSDHDWVTVFGSFNFGFLPSTSTSDLNMMVARKDINALLRFDELNHELARCNMFNQFKESRVTFMPNYPYKGDKYDIGDIDEIPIYAERILWKGKRCEAKSYRCHTGLKLGSHKPLSASFALGVREISEELLTKTYEAVIKSTDILVNMCRSSMTLDKNVIDFGKMSFLDEKHDKIIIRNQNVSPVEMNIVCVYDDSMNPPPWLKIEPLVCTLEKGKETKILISAKFSPDVMPGIQLGTIPLDVKVIFELRDGGVQFVNIVAELSPTSFGIPLEVLCSFSKSVKSESKEIIKSKIDEYRKTGPVYNMSVSAIPKELVQIIDTITESFIETPELFLKPSLVGDVKKIIASLDKLAPNNKLPTEGIPPFAFIEVLKLFFLCLPVPLLSSKYTTSSPMDVSNVMKEINQLPMNHTRILTYMVSFVKKVLENKEKNKSDEKQLADFFAFPMIGEDPFLGRTNRESRAKFMEIVLFEAKF